MTPQIKQRIEQIQRGEVPEGYKRTKAGVVPVEWEEVRIGDVLTQRKTLQCVSKDEPLLSFTIEEGVIDPADKKSNKRDFLIKDISTKKFALTEVGDIIYNPANLKFGAIHRNNLRRGVVSPIYGIFYGAQNSIFMGHLLHNQRFIDYAKIYAEGTVEKLKTLSADTFKKLKITLPSLKEQEKITKILSEQDRLIALKEKLINEKSRQKKVLMKKFFTQPCENIFSLAKIATITMGQSPESSSYNEEYSGVPLIQGNADITNRLPNPRMYTSEPTKMCNKNDILLSVRAPVGTVSKSNICACIGRGMCAINANELTEYVYQYLLYYEDKWGCIAQGSTFEAISGNDIAKLSIPVYENYKKIQVVLSNADKEIELLVHRLDQEKQKKKALMQLLLTGIVRV